MHKAATIEVGRRDARAGRPVLAQVNLRMHGPNARGFIVDVPHGGARVFARDEQLPEGLAADDLDLIAAWRQVWARSDSRRALDSRQ